MDGQWTDLLSEGEREVITTAQFGRRMGFGRRPAVLVIDAQNYMVGRPGGATTDYPSACGEPARQALERLVPVLRAARLRSIPIVYTQFMLRADGSDIGMYGLKRTFRAIDGWCIEGTEGVRIADPVCPEPSDLILVKKKPSAFFGTPLLSLLIDRSVDTVLVAGGSTSNCVRATVVDAVSYNFRAAVIGDCVFDRFEISHRATLFDLDRQYADVVASDEVIQYIVCGCV